MLYFHLRLGPPDGILYSGILTKLKEFLNCYFSNVILYFHLRLGPPDGILYSGILTKLKEFLKSVLPAKYLSHFITFNAITIMIFGDN
jgi:hypothetical protein